MSLEPSFVGAELAPYLALIVAGFLPNEAWRQAAVLLARGLDETSPLLRWVRAVATATLAGVIAKLLVFPSGSLTLVPLWLRLLAIALGAVAFYAHKRTIITGVAAGTAVLMIGAALLKV